MLSSNPKGMDSPRLSDPRITLTVTATIRRSVMERLSKRVADSSLLGVFLRVITGGKQKLPHQ